MLKGELVNYDVDKVALETVFEEHNSIYGVIHCATDYGHAGSVNNVFETNLYFPIKLVSLAVKYNVISFINTDTFLDKRISPYALSKNQLKEWMPLLRNGNLKIINIIVHHIYGPYDNEFKFIYKITNQLLNKTKDIKLTGGEQKRDFIYIDDVVDAYLRIVENLDNFLLDEYSFEVGTNVSTSLKDLVITLKRISKNTQTNLDFGFYPYRDFEEMIPNIDTSSIEKLGWSAKVSLDTGLKNLIQTLNHTHEKNNE